MSNLPVDRDSNYMREMWGTTKLVTDYGSTPQKKSITEEFVRHNLKNQTELHEKIRNDDDYDDWEYGTESCYGKNPLV